MLALTLFTLAAAAGDPPTAFPGAERLIIDLPMGDVQVTAREGADAVEIAGTRIEWDDRCRLEMDQSGDTVRVDVVVEGRRSASCRIDLEIAAPSAITVDLDLGLGGVSFQGVAGGVEIDLGAGDVDLDALLGALELDLGAGDLRGDAAGAIDVDIGAGDVRLRGMRGSAQVSVSAGDVKLGYAALPEEIEIAVGLGEVSLDLPEGATIRADLEAGLGQVRCEVERDAGAEQRVEISVGVGEIRVE